MLYQVIIYQMLLFLVNVRNLHIPYHDEYRPCLARSCRYTWSLLVSLLLIFVFLLVFCLSLSFNGPLARKYVHVNIPKYASQAWTYLLIILFMLYTYNKISPTNGVSFKEVLIPNYH